MCPNSIPVHFSLREICAGALMEVADELEQARDIKAFLRALEKNRHLWLAVQEFLVDGKLGPLRNYAEFAVRRCSADGRRVSDAIVSALVRNNRRAVDNLVGRGEPVDIRARLHLAYEDAGYDDFLDWLLAQVRRKFRIHLALDAAGGMRGESGRAE